jgi:hypothetical protein
MTGYLICVILEYQQDTYITYHESVVMWLGKSNGDTYAGDTVN